MNASIGSEKLISANNSSAIFFLVSILITSFTGFKSIFKTLSLHPGLTRRVVVVSIVSFRAFQMIYLAKCEFA